MSNDKKRKGLFENAIFNSILQQQLLKGEFMLVVSIIHLAMISTFQNKIKNNLPDASLFKSLHNLIRG